MPSEPMAGVALNSVPNSKTQFAVVKLWLTEWKPLPSLVWPAMYTLPSLAKVGQLYLTLAFKFISLSITPVVGFKTKVVLL